MARLTAILFLTSALGVLGQQPFKVQAKLVDGDGGAKLVAIEFTVPPHHYLYHEQLSVTLADSGGALIPVNPPKPKKKYDTTFEKEMEIYDHSFGMVYKLSNVELPATVLVAYQGCSADACFLPTEETFSLGGESIKTASGPETGGTERTTGEWEALADNFELAGKQVGYMSSDKFLAFLHQAETGVSEKPDLLTAVFQKYGLLVAILVVLPLGFLLNLTPCVLPMIPVNLAIMGAGAQAGSKARGFGLGSLYGAGMAIVYGALGVIVVLTGSRFGQINASPWFNVGIAIFFVGMALAMFDLWILDFSRFQKMPTPGKKSTTPFVTAFVLGCTAALLAGACVAPVLISVLLLATDLYAKGTPSGLILPFALGAGMALPWPFAGAGLSFLPKPGTWMIVVKKVMGVLILGAGLYYGYAAYQLFSESGGTHEVSDHQGWETDLEVALVRAQAEAKPLLVDFWSLTCKSCLKMKATTFKDSEVLGKLQSYVVVELQTDGDRAKVAKQALERYGVLGLPTYLVLKPLRADAP